MMGRITQTSKRYILKPEIKLLLIVFFILSLLSIFLGLFLVANSVATSPLPDFPYAMTEHAWKFFLVIPIPLTSIILGIIYKKKGYPCKKNVVGGIIITILLCLYGGFTSTFSKNISHDFKHANELSNTIHIEIPEDSYLSYTSKYTEQISSLLMVKISLSSQDEFLRKIEDNENWKDNTHFIPSDSKYASTLLLTKNYDYFAVFNKTKNVYSDFDGELIYLAYRIETRVLYACTYIYQ